MVAVAERAAERLLEVPVYRPGRASPGADAGKLSSNEAPLGPSPDIQAAMSSSLARVNRYPEPAQALDALARYVGTSPDRLMLTNGSDELCYLVATLLLGPGRVAVVGEPVLPDRRHRVRWSRAPPCDASRCATAGTTLRPWPRHRPAPRSSGCRRRTTRPGSPATRSSWRTFLSAVPEDCLVVLDEAYRAFSDPEVRPDVDDLLATHPNLLVQRTLSKDWALAGLRIGYGLASAPLVEALSRARPPFSVNVLALAAVEAAVQHEASEAWRAMSVDRVRQERARLEHALGAAGCGVLPEPGQLRHRPARPGCAGPGPGRRRDRGPVGRRPRAARMGPHLASAGRRRWPCCAAFSTPGTAPGT